MVYLVSQLANKNRVAQIARKLESLGITITYDWSVHGAVTDHINEIANKEIEGVYKAKAILAITPLGNGSHFELGAAHALNKPIIILHDNDWNYGATSFHHLGWPLHTNEDDAINALLEAIR